MSNPIPPVLAGIAIGAVSTAIWADRENAWRRWSDWAETRIRELETEALFRQADLAELRARAEKAEARVAELKTALREANTSAYDEAVARHHAREREAESDE